MHKNKIIIRHLGLQPYDLIYRDMHNFTDNRGNDTIDEIWLVEHLPVFTQGQAGKLDHLVLPNNIPLIQSDRGGQITYHGPGQQIVYVLLDIKRKKIGVHNLVLLLGQTVINTLYEYEIHAHYRSDAPGVYVGRKKICSIGLRIHKYCSLHGLALNVNMDLSPFMCIDPCGFPGMEMTQMSNWDANITPNVVCPQLIKYCLAGLESIVQKHDASYLQKLN